jgi:hypothetical protein
MALLPMDKINSGLKDLGEAVKESPCRPCPACSRGRTAQVLLRAMFEINSPVRSAP